MIHFSGIQFTESVYKLAQLPAPELPEIIFAGRSNVGKSSLINCLVDRKNLVKTSSKPGKTQSLNYFMVPDLLYLVDLPGYGYAKVPKNMQDHWQRLITEYLQTRPTLRCVVVIVDLRHDIKVLDLELVSWLRNNEKPFLLVYTKQDKLSGNERTKMARSLDIGFHVSEQERVLFSAKTGQGKEQLLVMLDRFIC
jgi:GTP-binding protein